MPQDHEGKWIAHDGGPIPVGGKTQVEVRLFNGNLFRHIAGIIHWDRSRPQCDWVVAYRIIP
jgi:hypothetical protein